MSDGLYPSGTCSFAFPPMAVGQLHSPETTTKPLPWESTHLSHMRFESLALLWVSPPPPRS